MFNDFLKSVAQFSDPRFRKVVLIGVAGALATIVALWVLIWFGLNSITFFTDGGWLETAVDWVLGIGLTLLVLLLFPAATVLISSLLLDQIADAVEDKHYPTLPDTRPQPIMDALISGLKFALTALALNILLLPLLLAGPLYVIAFYMMNGYLLSREYFELVAARRYDARTVEAIRKSRQKKLWIAGVGLTFLMTIPVVNLVAPIIATAFMVHYSVRLGTYVPEAA
ncbi:EI24 domain-containing protein [Thalassospira sp.]|uniref:EI24 domain-containing protein n=1 Tax=Thalassospira sp. TaxID=1912094 RepID=UPI001B0AB57A|nr:EI24 domain-containing protein [Thalassospira sp.]MBO6806596.1 EI24 domain-containing protein [Thalassospira sp.]MBO6838883.1 EI24 domain-containing protein [Thalassospira sp.]